MSGLDNASEPRWVVVHTRPRCEKKFADLLSREKFAHELPLVRSVRRYRTQTKRFTKPLFPGYVFGLVPPEKSSRLYQGNFVANLIQVSDQPAFLQQLDAIRRIMAAGVAMTPVPTLVKGTRVRIAGGPLHGVEGVVEHPHSPRGVVVAIDVIQQGVLIHLPPEQIEIVS